MPAPHGACYVEREDLLKSLLDDGSKEEGYNPSASRSVNSNRSRAAPASSAGEATEAPGSRKKYLSDMQVKRNQQVEADRRAIDKVLTLKKEVSEKVLGKLSTKVESSMKFLEGVDRELNLVDETRRTKTRRQFEEWNTNVHGALQRKITQAVNAIPAAELHASKLAEYDKFLAITNRKPSIFRDIIIESEYDPLENNKGCVKIRTQTLKDPTNIDAQKFQAENSLLPPSSKNGRAGTKKPQLCKETLDVRQWAKEKIGATPYGMFASLMDEAGQGESKEKHKRTTSNVVFDDFQFPRGEEGKAAVNKEMPKGKPRSRVVYADPTQVYPMSPSVRKTLQQYSPPY